MAVVPMQKVRVVTHRDDVDDLLNILQKAGAMEIVECELEEKKEVKSEFPLANLLPRVEHAVNFLTPYEKKRSLWKSLREGSFITLNEEVVGKKSAETDSVAMVVDDLENVQVELAEVNNKIKNLEEKAEFFENWKDLKFPLSSLNTNHTQTVLVKGGYEDKDVLSDKLEKFLSSTDQTYVVTPVTKNTATITFNIGGDKKTIEQAVEMAGGNIVEVPEGEKTAIDELSQINSELQKEKLEQGRLHDQAEHFAILHLRNLKTAKELFNWQRERYVALNFGSATEYTVVLDGWLNATKSDWVKSEIEKAGLTAVLEEVPMKEGEEPPVEIANNPWIAPFEVVTRLYGMPGYKDLDPTLFLAGFFFLFFGLSLTDVGYGAFLMVVSVIILTLFKVPPFVRTFAKLLLFMGLSAVLVGLLFGGYLGINPEYLPESLKALQKFDPIGDPLPVFYLALGLGVFQIMIGMMLKIYSEARNNRLVTGLLDQGPWLLMFFILIAYLATVTGYLDLLEPAVLVNLIYVAIVIIVLSSGRNGKTILEKVQKSALSLYDSIGYFSDILSYSRLLALGLATTALAFAVNLIADIVSNSLPYLGPVLAIIVLIIGHLFTLAVNTLGAFIHSARLQFVEFFGKFIAGTGREFKPLKRNGGYVTVTEET